MVEVLGPIQLRITDKHWHWNPWKWWLFTGKDSQVLKTFSEWEGMVRTVALKVGFTINPWGASASPNSQAGHIRISQSGAQASVLFKIPQCSQVWEPVDQKIRRKLQGWVEGVEVYGKPL